MAALYLHQALFADDAPPTSFGHRHSRPAQGRALSSISSATVDSTLESSHTSVPLFEPFPDSPAYQDLLAMQPPHPSEGSHISVLTLQGDPMTDRERKRRWEKDVRKRLRRLLWARRLLTAMIAGWAIYNTVRYYVAFTIYVSHDRQAVLLVLGSVTALSLALTLGSQLIGAFAHRLTWINSARSPYSRIQISLTAASSILLLGPTVANLVLVFSWRRSSDRAQSLQGRCHWDIDVAWSGTGHECGAGDAPSWGAWLAGAIVRLLLTALALAAYHYISYMYSVIKRPSRRYMGRTHSHSISSSGDAFLHAPSMRSSRTMTSTATLPVTTPRMLRYPSQATSESDITRESTSVRSLSDQPPLRRSGSRITADGYIVGDGRVRPGHISFSTHAGPSSHGHSIRDEPIPESPTSSDEEYANIPAAGFGRPSHIIAGSYAAIPPSFPMLSPASVIIPALEDQHISGENFHALMEEVARETEAGIRLVQNDQHGYYSDTDSSIPERVQFIHTDDERTDYVPVVGRIISRMPTIESLGSREVMSLSSVQRGDRSAHTLSRPPTRANTLVSEAFGSQPPSRSNSLTASNILSSPVEGPINDLGEYLDSPHGSNHSSSHGTKSTMSYYTAMGTTSSADSAAAR